MSRNRISRDAPLEERLWSKVHKPDDADGCWEWQGTTTKEGYGQLQYRGKMRSAHRLSYEIASGEAIPLGLCVCHKCDNRKCVRPDHLFLGTISDNSRDMVAKGRHGRRKLMPDDVLKIRGLRMEGLLQRQIGDVFGVHQTAIGEVLSRKAWHLAQEGGR